MNETNLVSELHSLKVVVRGIKKNNAFHIPNVDHMNKTNLLSELHSLKVVVV